MRGVFLNSFEPHEVEIKKEPYRRYFAMVDPSELERAYPLSRLPSVFKNRRDGFCHCVSLSKEGEYPFWLFRRLKEEYELERPASDQMLQSILEQILIFLCEVAPQNFTSDGKRIQKPVGEVQRYIEAHFTEDLKISKLAEQFFLNHCYLTHLFKEQVGCSPKQYILLNQTVLCSGTAGNHFLQVSQIAFKCGFGDANNFIRAFRTQYGLSPNQYRAQNTR